MRNDSVFDDDMMAEVNRLARDGVKSGEDLFAVGVFLDLCPMALPEDNIPEKLVASVTMAARKCIFRMLRAGESETVSSISGRSWAIQDITNEVLRFVERVQCAQSGPFCDTLRKSA